MIITVNPIYSKITISTDYENSNTTELYLKILKKIKSEFIIERNIYKKNFRKSGGSFKKDTIDLLTTSNYYSYTFLTGFLPEIFNYLNKYSISTENKNLIINYNYTLYPNINFTEISEIPRNYQIDAVSTALSSGTGLIVGAVGSGKTLCMALTLSALTNYHAIILVPGKELLRQIKSELERIIINYKIISATEYQDSLFNKINAVIGLPIHFRNWNIDALKKFPVLVMDEAHQSVADVAMSIIEQQSAPYRYGFTATPTGRSDGRDKLINGLFGSVIEAIDYGELVKGQFAPKIQTEIYHAGWEDDYVYMEDLLIVNNIRRNTLIYKIVTEHIRKTKNPLILILSRRLEHLDILKNQFFQDAALITGEMSSEEREKIIIDIKKRKYNIVLASSVFAQGINIPEFTLGLNASGGKSTILSEQKSGRMARGDITGIKTWVDLYDTYTNVLDRHSQSRMLVYGELYGKPKLIGFPPSRYQKVNQLLIDNKIS